MIDFSLKKISCLNKIKYLFSVNKYYMYYLNRTYTMQSKLL